MSTCVMQHAPEDYHHDLTFPVKATAAVLLVFAAIFYFGSVAVWVRHRKDDWLAQRSTTWMLVSAIGGSYTTAWHLAQVLVDRDSFPCIVPPFSSVGYAMLLVPAVVRLSLFYNRSRWQSSLERSNRDGYDFEEFDRLTIARSARVFLRLRRRDSLTPDVAKTLSDEELAERSAIRLLESDLLLRFFFTTKLYSVLLFTAFALWPISFVIFQLLSHDNLWCVGCRPSIMDDIGLLVTLLSIFMAFGFMLNRIRDAPDPLEIKKEMKALVAVVAIGAVSFAVGVVDPGSASQRGHFSYSLPNTIIIMMGHFFQCPWQIWRMHVEAQRSETSSVADSQGDPYESRDHTLDAILSSNSGRQAFVDHLLSEFASEGYYFHEAVTRYKLASFSSSPASMHKLALRIFKTFVQAGSILEVNISSKVRAKIAADILKLDPSAGAPRDIFDAAQKEIKAMLSADSFQRFLLSPLYKTWRMEAALNPMIKVVRSTFSQQA